MPQVTFRRHLFAILIAISSAACAPTNFPKQKLGTLAGGAGGAFAGQMFGSGNGRLAATAAGSLLGALIGNNLGRSLDRADILYMQRARNQALEYAPSGASVGWVNPSTGRSGTVTPLGTYRRDGGGYCRDYTITATIDGASERVRGTACRQIDGTWRITS